jgi:hypothetical protein
MIPVPVLPPTASCTTSENFFKLLLKEHIRFRMMRVENILSPPVTSEHAIDCRFWHGVFRGLFESPPDLTRYENLLLGSSLEKGRKESASLIDRHVRPIPAAWPEDQSASVYFTLQFQ